MVDIKDLMVGNLINTRDGIVEVGKIHRDSVGDKWGAIYFDDEIEVIEVTEEMLEKIGFEKHKNFPLEGDFYRYWHKDYKYKLDARKFWCNSNRKWYVHIDNEVCNTIGSGEFTYIHELMNLVRVVTGYELKIDKGLFNE